MVSAHIFDLKSVCVSQTVVTRLQRLWEAQKGGELMELHLLLLDDKAPATIDSDIEETLKSLLLPKRLLSRCLMLSRISMLTWICDCFTQLYAKNITPTDNTDSMKLRTRIQAAFVMDENLKNSTYTTRK
ncbi:phosphoenolpyruvate carboxylase 2-like [Brassica rapa]|uniref:phosphoenolpyruvate carboxylase 2-like n=1 Tax=Brassica campestris TaxID=3711 RepID=UPI00142D2E52|nr:phosphoenolpyruvate carboxylase 2-like [Brassica rapa]